MVTSGPHLYSVDSTGQTTDATPPGPSNTASPQRNKQKARPRFPVPTDRLKREKQDDALRVVAVASRNGQEPVDAAKMAALMDVTADTAPLNNAFFVSIGLMKKVGKGEYLPTDLTLDYQQRWSFDKAAAPSLLAPAFASGWFFDAIKQRLQVGPATRDQLIETLASEARTDSSYARQYGFILDWLEYVGLIVLKDGNVTLTANTGPAEASTATDGSGSEPPAPPDPPPAPPKPAPPAPSEVTTVHQPEASPPVVRLAFEVVLTATDLALMAPEQITALFDGIGKVAAAKATLEQN